jgi:hypothetical protein
VLGMPAARSGHEPTAFAGAEVVFEFSQSDAVLPNVRDALAGGVRRFVIGTTAWADDRAEVERLLPRRAPGRLLPSFSLGVMLFLDVKTSSARSPSTTRTSWSTPHQADRPPALPWSSPQPRSPAQTAHGQLGPRRPAPEELDVTVIRPGPPRMHRRFRRGGA